MEKNRVYIFVVETMKFIAREGKKTQIERILPIAYTLPSDTRFPQHLGNTKSERLLGYVKSQISKEELKKAYENHKKKVDNGLESKESKLELEHIELVTAKKAKWVYGEYFAHEYNETVEGRVRQIKYSNGFVEYEIECLDATKSVLDGMWPKEEADEHHGRYTNGCGDTFYAWDNQPWVKEKKTNETHA